MIRATTHDENVRRKDARGDLVERFVENVEDLGGEKDVPVEIEVPSTGDTSNIAVWAGLMVLAASAAAAVVIYKKKAA